jgi:hypothetical protein
MLENYSSDSSTSIVRSLDLMFEQVEIPSRKIRIDDYLQSICGSDHPQTQRPLIPSSL